MNNVHDKYNNSVEWMLLQKGQEMRQGVLNFDFPAVQYLPIWALMCLLNTTTSLQIQPLLSIAKYIISISGPTKYTTCFIQLFIGHG